MNLYTLLISGKRYVLHSLRHCQYSWNRIYHGLRHNLLNRPKHELFIALPIVAILLFASPIINWWANPNHGWLTPYLLWAIIIALAYLIQRLHNHDL